MKKSLMGAVLALFSVFLSQTEAANTFDWQNDTGSTVYDVNGTTPMPESSTYYVMLVQAANSTSIGFNPVTQTVGAGESLVWYANWSPDMPNGDGNFALTIQGSDTAPIGASGVAGFASLATYYYYTVVLDASAPGAGVNNYLVLEGVTPTSVTVDGAGGAIYNAPVNGTWQPVPEPSSIALLGLGLGLVALRRKMRK